MKTKTAAVIALMALSIQASADPGRQDIAFIASQIRPAIRAIDRTGMNTPFTLYSYSGVGALDAKNIANAISEALDAEIVELRRKSSRTFQGHFRAGEMGDIKSYYFLLFENEPQPEKPVYHDLITCQTPSC